LIKAERRIKLFNVNAEDFTLPRRFPNQLVQEYSSNSIASRFGNDRNIQDKNVIRLPVYPQTANRFGAPKNNIVSRSRKIGVIVSVLRLVLMASEYFAVSGSQHFELAFASGLEYPIKERLVGVCGGTQHHIRRI